MVAGLAIVVVASVAVADDLDAGGGADATTARKRTARANGRR